MLKRTFIVMVVATSFIFYGCGGGGGGVNASTGASVPTTSDFFHLAIVPDQSVNSTAFEVQVIAENIDHNTSPTPPIVTDSSGKSYVMTQKYLQWPNTVDDSVSVYSATISLSADQLNNIVVTSGTKNIAFSVKHKSALSLLTALNSAQLVEHIKMAIRDDPTIDIIEIDYNEPDLGSVIHNVGNSIINKRSTWLTIKPASGRTVSWARDFGIPARRPMVDFLNVNGVTFGSDVSDGGGGQFYAEVGHRIWLSGAQFRGKYKRTWPKTSQMTASYLPDIRVIAGEWQKVYFTNCLWDGTASTVATSNVQLARDLIFNSHRGDFNNFGKVFINVLAQDISPVLGTDGINYLHNDGFQVWGTASDIVFKGLKITSSPGFDTEIQPFLFDRTYTPNYSNILADTVIIQGAPITITLKAQLAGLLTNSRISNFSFPTQSLTIRQDFVDPNGAFGPNNVRIYNFDVKSVEYYGSGATTYTSAGVPDPTDISSILNSNKNLSGAIFSAIKLN